jgi:DNA-3-methyladenine glycosylase II
MNQISGDIKKMEIVFERDPVLMGLYQKFGMPEVHIGEGLFNDLIRSIVGQQLSVMAAKTIYGRFVQLFTDQVDAEAIIEKEIEELRSAGLSGQKASYIKNVAVFFLENKLLDKEWDDLSDEEITELLIQIKGVGLWTIQMILMFSLHRPDVFPVGDLGIQMGMKQMYKLDLEGKFLRNEIVKIAEKWEPYRSVASKLVWLGKDEK